MRSEPAREHFERLTTCGDEHHVPKHADIFTHLEQPTQSVIVNLVADAYGGARSFCGAADRSAGALCRHELAGPHVVVLDQAERS